MSLARQYRQASERLPEGFVIVRCYWDIESGGIELDSRSQDGLWRKFAGAGIPRDGGMAELRAAVATGQRDVQRSDLRGHQPGRPRHARQPAAGKRAAHRRSADLRDQRADRRAGPGRLDHAGPADADGRIGILPVQPQDDDVGRAPAVRHRRPQHRQMPLRVRRGTHPAPQPDEGQHGSHPRPARPRPQPGPVGQPHVRVAGLRETVSVRHRPPPHRPGRTAARPGCSLVQQHRQPDPAQPQVHRPGCPGPHHQHRPDPPQRRNADHPAPA